MLLFHDGPLTVSSHRIIYSPLPYRGNLITIYRGIGLIVSLELRIFYSPRALNLYRGNWITIYRCITYIAQLQNYYLLFHFEQ